MTPAGGAGLEDRYGAEDTTPWDVIIAGLTVWAVIAALLVLLIASTSGILTASRTVRTFAARFKSHQTLDLEPAAVTTGVCQPLRPWLTLQVVLPHSRR